MILPHKFKFHLEGREDFRYKAKMQDCGYEFVVTWKSSKSTELSCPYGVDEVRTRIETGAWIIKEKGSLDTETMVKALIKRLESDDPFPMTEWKGLFALKDKLNEVWF